MAFRYNLDGIPRVHRTNNPPFIVKSFNGDLVIKYDGESNDFILFAHDQKTVVHIDIETAKLFALWILSYLAINFLTVRTKGSAG